MKIAVTSQNFRTVTGHGGKSRRFLIYDAQPGTPPTEVDRLDLPIEQSFHEFSGGSHPVDGVDALVTGSAGSGFIRKLAERGIRVVVTGETDPVKAVDDVLAGHITPPAPHDCDHHEHQHQHGHRHQGGRGA
jgi:predicted Fe-Mo cluster-binding NifX family protein